MAYSCSVLYTDDSVTVPATLSHADDVNEDIEPGANKNILTTCKVFLYVASITVILLDPEGLSLIHI